MAPKSKYIIVRLASVISNTTRVWVRERAGEEYSGIFFDPAIGKNTLFKEVHKVKGKHELTKKVKKMYNLS